MTRELVMRAGKGIYNGKIFGPNLPVLSQKAALGVQRTAPGAMAAKNPSVSVCWLLGAAFNKYSKKEISSGKKLTLIKDEIKGCGLLTQAD